jgi:hypothetical protein
MDYYLLGKLPGSTLLAQQDHPLDPAAGRSATRSAR